MKYFSLFSGIGGFEHGIQRASKQIPSTSERQKEVGDSRIFNNETRRNLRHSGQSSSTCDGSSPEGVQQRGILKNMSNPERPEFSPEPFCVGFSEIDKYAIQIYKKHFPKHKEYGNVSNIKWSDVSDFEILCGGFPCQSFSIAGKRGGFSDTRGTLFFEIVRAAQEKQPRLLFLENVKGLLSHDKGRTFGTILNTLDELGYDLQWQVLNSKNFGVPQNRERVFIIGHLRGTSRLQVFPIGEGSQGNLKYCGGVISAREKWLDNGKSYSRNFSQGQRIYSTEGISQTLAGNAGGQGGKTGLYEISKTVRSGGIGSPYSSRQNWDSYKIGDNIRRLTPTECERLQGFPDGWTEGISDTQRYKCLGNAVTVNVIEAITEKIIGNTTKSP
ncbi:MAG TPA: DNA (cytosine-5-)-methyltransferase [Pricia sp.]|nr:DNA (cytosine-5-)-methyltransferase [Pricia sp.]